MHAEADAPGWAGALMGWLRIAARLMTLNLLWLLGVLAGGVLLGVAPASFAVTAAHREEHLWRSFWVTWRSQFARANLLALPFWAVGAIVAADVAVFLTAPDATLAWMLVPFGVVAVAAAIAVAHLAPVALRHDEQARVIWRWVFLSPVTAPLVALVIAGGLTLWVAVLAWWPVLLLLGGVSVPLVFADTVVARRLNT